MTAAGMISVILAAAGFVVMLISLTGLIRFPDFFTRLHIQGVGDTLGALLIILGMMAATGSQMLSLKLLLIFLIIMLTNPIGTNLMMIAAIYYEDYQAYSRVRPGESSDSDRAEHDKALKSQERSEERPAADKAVEDEVQAENAEPSPDKSSRSLSGSSKQSKQSKPTMKRTRSELIAIAGEMNIAVPERATKKEILELIYQRSPESMPKSSGKRAPSGSSKGGTDSSSAKKNGSEKKENSGKKKNNGKRKSSVSNKNDAVRNSSGSRRNAAKKNGSGRSSRNSRKANNNSNKKG